MDGWGIKTKKWEGERREEGERNSALIVRRPLAVWAPTCRWDREENGCQIRRRPWELLPPQWRLDSGQRDAPETPGAPRSRHSLSATFLRSSVTPLQLWQMTINGDCLMEFWSKSYLCVCFVTVFWRIKKRHAKLHTHESRVFDGVLKCVTMKMPLPTPGILHLLSQPLDMEGEKK